MKIFNFGSINIDLVYSVPHFPAPGETLQSTDHQRGLGGKGANMSIALAASGADIHHIGAVGHDGSWTRSTLQTRGVNVDHIQEMDVLTGHAIIQVDAAGENAITLFSGANSALSKTSVLEALETATPGDWLLLQNETSHVLEAARFAKDKGLKVAYAAAPFDAEATQAVLPYLDLIALNAVEAAQLETAMGTTADQLNIPRVLVTRGGEGATLYVNGQPLSRPAVQAKVVDTTGAGDTFLGIYLGCLAQEVIDIEAMDLALKIAAIQVARTGAADAIPSQAEVEALKVSSS